MRRNRIGWVAWWGATCFLGLGSLWIVDRTRRWETPRLDAALFTVLREASAPGPIASSVRLAAVSLSCPHCMQSLRRLQAEAARGRAPDFVVLLVDQEHAPPRSAIESLEAERVWWDRRGIWRRRWGHRIYGEVLRFDRTGRYLGTTPPPSDVPASSDDPLEAPEPDGMKGGDSG